LSSNLSNNPILVGVKDLILVKPDTSFGVLAIPLHQRKPLESLFQYTFAEDSGATACPPSYYTVLLTSLTTAKLVSF
jgi:hypothetical protein